MSEVLVLVETADGAVKKVSQELLRGRSALGVEGMESALQIARHPPKPSRSKQNQGQKTKRQRQGKTSGDVIVGVPVKEERKVLCY